MYVGTSIDASMAIVWRPCTWCCGSSETSGAPRQPTSRTIGHAYTSGWAAESSGLTALPRPEFCMYTSGTSPVAMWCPRAMPTEAPSLAVMTWRIPALGLSSSAQKVAMQLSGTPGYGDGQG